MKRALFYIFAFCYLITGVSAGERTESEIKRIAWSVLYPNTNSSTRATEDGANKLEIVKKLDAITIVADKIGFVIVSNQDSHKPVLGYSFTNYSSEQMPDGFCWWLNTINKNMSSSQSVSRSPVPSRLKESVEPMIKTKWGQGTPYKDLCPKVDGRACVTGCVATAMAQICNYHHYPEYGRNKNVYQTTIAGVKTTIEKDFSNIHFDYDNMLNEYVEGAYNSQQANAVATLMEACGKAADTAYGLESSSSGCGFMQSAMTFYLGYSFSVSLDENSFKWAKIDDTVWKDIIYSNISKGLPVYYAGGYHGFIFDGYDKDGNVHVNWGWNGRFDGYFSIDNLKVNGGDFNKNQSMVVDIRPQNYDLQVYEVNVANAGTLKSLVDEDEVLYSDRLKVSGNINMDDFVCLRGLILSGRLMDLDLYDAHIVDGNEVTFDDTNIKYTVKTKENEIPDYAFSRTIYLAGLILPKDTKSIGKCAFMNCYLKKLFIPASTTKISSDAFVAGKATMEVLEVEEGNPVYDSRNNCNGIIITATNELFTGCQTTKIPDEVTIIGENAFANCIWLKEINWPSNLVAIADYAFSSCSRLGDIRIPEGVKTIGKHAFEGCGDDLQNIDLPSTLDSIGDFAFRGVHRIQSFKLPAGVKFIGHNIISYCRSLKSVTVEEGNAHYDSRDNCNGIIEKANNKLVAGCATTTIPQDVTTIGDYALYGFYNKSIVIPEWVTAIGEYAFAESYDLISVVLPKSLTQLGRNAFHNCSALSSFEIPEKITSIPSTLLAGCSKLNSVIIPQSVTSIGGYAFSGCSKLKNVISKIDNPFEIGEEIFSSETYSNATLTVPLNKKSVYQATKHWNLFKNIEEKDYSHDLTPIETETAINTSSLGESNLANVVINDVYYNIGSDAYDKDDHSIVISEGTNMNQISNKEPGSDDVVNRFHGIILKIGKGKGSIKIDALTKGQSLIAIQVGDNTPTITSKVERGDVSIDYDTETDSFVYIYSRLSTGALSRGEADDMIKIYGIVISPNSSGINPAVLIEHDKESYYSISGQKINFTPTKRGIYIKDKRKIIVK